MLPNLKTHIVKLVTMPTLITSLLCALPSLAAEKPIHVACVGDSTTFGMNIVDREQFSYPAQLQTRLGDDYAITNFGANGATAIRNTPDFTPFITRDVYEASLNSEPDMVIVTLGANDSKTAYWHPEQYRRDLTRLINEYLALTPHVLLGLPAPAYNQPGRWDVNESNLTLARAIVTEIAHQHQLPLVDFYTPLQSPQYFQADGVHPNAIGATQMAEAVERALANVHRQSPNQ